MLHIALVHYSKNKTDRKCFVQHVQSIDYIYTAK